jgi:hypothetical protein
MRAFLVIFVMVAFMAACGCAGGKAVAENSERLSALERDTSDLQANMEEVCLSLDRLSESLELLERTADGAIERVERPRRIKEGTKRASEKVRTLDEKLDMLERADPSGIRVKVLVGDGDPDSGDRMADLLRRKGYDVGAVDTAPSFFRRRTVFYSDGYRDAAQVLAADLDADLKALSWGSIFDMIVVTAAER